MNNFSQQIYTLSNLKYNNISNNDSTYITIANQKDDSVLVSKSISISAVQENVTNIVENLSSFSPTGKWTFTKGITLPERTFERAIKNGISSTLVPKYFIEDDFMKLLKTLSTEIYVNNHIPSTVGEVIFSTSLRSETAVKKYYGNYTSWRQIPGRFILATHSSPNSELSKPRIKGGEATHLITVNEIPEHKHSFKPTNNEKELKVSKTVDIIPDDAGYDKVLTGKTPKIGNGNCDEGSTLDYNAKLAWLNISYGEGATKIGHIYGDAGADAIIKENSSKNKAHTNMPPFYSIYIWERIN